MLLREARSSRSSPPCSLTYERDCPLYTRPIHACLLHLAAAVCLSWHLRCRSHLTCAGVLAARPHQRSQLRQHCYHHARYTRSATAMSDAQLEENIDLLFNFGVEQLDRQEARQLLAVCPNSPQSVCALRQTSDYVYRTMATMSRLPWTSTSAAWTKEVFPL